MKHLHLLLVLGAMTILWITRAVADADRGGAGAQHYWPQWRGPLGTGVGPSANPPVEWSEKKNIRWKAALPGKGHSTPIISGQHVFLSTAIPYGEALKARVPGIATYQTIFLCFPIWGETAPPVIRSFLTAHDLSAKTLKPLTC